MRGRRLCRRPPVAGRPPGAVAPSRREPTPTRSGEFDDSRPIRAVFVSAREPPGITFPPTPRGGSHVRHVTAYRRNHRHAQPAADLPPDATGADPPAGAARREDPP